MRLFLIGLWIVAVATACKSEQEPKAGALRVDLSYATFRPGCLTLKAVDKADPSHEVSQQVTLGNPVAQSRQLTVAVFREEGWSRDLVLTATAFEGPCTAQNPRQVATQTREAQVPEEGVEPVAMQLRAEDLDDDGFVRSDQGGSDCNDNDKQVKPGATEVCNGKDDNCSGDESDAAGGGPFYADEDKDGFGDPQRPTTTCIPPAGYVTNNRDCDDLKATVRPDQNETLCDGVDDNCNGTADDSFSVGASCMTAQSCSGAIACQGTASTTCVSSQTPTNWFVDLDGDQHAGTATGPSCVQPPGGVTQSSDCDDSSRFSLPGGTERCDRLDNNCDNTTDEGCGARLWLETPGTGNTLWRAVSSYAENKAWVAGPNNALAHIDGTTVTQHSDCQGNWISAWANPVDGRVFLGSEQGELATRALGGGTGCTIVQTGRTSAVNGLVGFGSGASATLFAVTSEGRIFRWEYSSTGASNITVDAQVTANLRDIHGTSPTNLLAVGKGPVNSFSLALAFSKTPATGMWTRETLPNTLPEDIFLRGVHMVHSQLAYAAGDEGVVLQRSNGTWSELPRLPSASNAIAVIAYGRTALYVVSNTDRNVYFSNGSSWFTDHSPSWTPNAIDGVVPDNLWVAGSQGAVLRWGP